MSIRLGVIGAGAIGKRHVEAAVAAGIDVACVADQDQTAARLLAERCEASYVTDSARLLCDEKINAVIVAVPNYLHRRLAIDAMRAGKDVLLEKPMGFNVDECAQINDVAAASGRVLQVGLAHRYSAVGKAAQELADAEHCGRIYHAKAQLYQRRGVPGLGGWFTTKEQSGGGALMDLGVHLLDLALFVLGFPQPKEVTGQVYAEFGRRMQDYVFENMWAGPPNLDGVCDVEDSAHAFIRFEDQVTLELNVTWAGNFPTGQLPASRMGFFGDRGGMTFELFGDHIHVANEQFRRNVDTKIKLAERDYLQEQLKCFARAVANRRLGLGASGPQAAVVQSLIDAIYKSSEEQCAVEMGQS